MSLHPILAGRIRYGAGSEIAEAHRHLAEIERKLASHRETIKLLEHDRRVVLKQLDRAIAGTRQVQRG
jgi:hypothetical protein